jgi:hypothetical protein
MIAVAKVFCLWIETGSMFRPIATTADPEELLYAS